MKSRFRPISGILLLDKPPGMSSNQALQKARHLFEAEKAGHTGSLDPLATGLLPLCFGEATKVAGLLLGARKAYRAELELGATTTTDDSDGEVLERRPVPAFDAAAIEAALAPLRGRIVQVPPAYSAIKQGGVALYKRARRGEAVEVPARTVEVQALSVIEQSGARVALHVECGSGTYVRSLARDFGAALGCGAHLTALRRLWVEPFREPAMASPVGLAEIKAAEGLTGLDRRLLPLAAGLAAWPRLDLTSEQAQLLRQGRSFAQNGLKNLEICCAFDAAGRLVALVRIDATGDVRVNRGFND
jgi:tRNA pseudouridine55 synthase